MRSQRVLVSLQRGKQQLAGVIGAEAPAWPSPSGHRPGPVLRASSAKASGTCSSATTTSPSCCCCCCRRCCGRSTASGRARRVWRGGARYRHHRHRVHHRAFDHAGTGGDGHRAPAHATHRSGHRRIDRLGCGHQPAAATVAPAIAAGLRFRPGARLRICERAGRDRRHGRRRCCHCSRGSTSAWKSPSSRSSRRCCRSSTWRAALAGMPPA